MKRREIKRFASTYPRFQIAVVSSPGENRHRMNSFTKTFQWIHFRRFELSFRAAGAGTGGS